MGKEPLFFIIYARPRITRGKDKGMSSENKKDPEWIRVSAPGDSPETERQIEETKVLLRDTRALLDQIADGEHQTRLHIEELKESLEEDLRRLKAEDREGTEEKDL